MCTHTRAGSDSKAGDASPAAKLGVYVVGDDVLVHGHKRGTVRYVGNTRFGTGTWVGVELKRGVGLNDGAVGGVRYFACPANHVRDARTRCAC